MKKLQNALYITRDGAYLHKQRETLLIEQRVEGEKQKLMQLPIHAIGHIFCFGNIMVSPQLMGFCGESGTTLAFFDGFGRFLSRMVGRQSGNVLLRRAQFHVTESNKTDIAKGIVAAKVQSSRAVLQRHVRNHGGSSSVNDAIGRLKQIIAEVKNQSNIDSVRGFEGEAASQYFSVFNELITVDDGELCFDNRNRRPPKDPINAMLSFFYAILGQEISGALQGVGLDPQVGFLHAERPGRDSLAQDLLEELRAFVVDRLVLNLINRQQIKASDFSKDMLGGVRLRDDARKAVLQAWQSKKQEVITHPFLNEKIEIGLLPHVQSMLLARHLRGDLQYYPPFVMR